MHACQGLEKIIFDYGGPYRLEALSALAKLAAIGSLKTPAFNDGHDGSVAALICKDGLQIEGYFIQNSSAQLA